MKVITSGASGGDRDAFEQMLPVVPGLHLVEVLMKERDGHVHAQATDRAAWPDRPAGDPDHEIRVPFDELHDAALVDSGE